MRGMEREKLGGWKGRNERDGKGEMRGMEMEK